MIIIMLRVGGGGARGARPSSLVSAGARQGSYLLRSGGPAEG